MPPAKRAPSSSSKSNSSSSKPATKRATGSRATKAAASRGAKATGTSAAKAGGRTATQAKSAATRTRNAAASGASTTRRSANSGGSAKTTAKTAGAAAASTAKAARSGARATGTAAKSGAKSTRSTARRAATNTSRASGGDGIASIAEQLVKGTIKPTDVVMLTRDRIRETLDDAASRGRVTRKDADDLVTELVQRGRSQSEDLRSEIESLLGRVETTAKRARGSKPVDRLVRGADRARRAAGVGPTFPIMDYDNLNVGQIQSRLKDLGKPDLRKVLTYERKHADRKTVVGAIEKSLG
jgi:polyhydroxyalkanoate synthesis regulator phasin